MPDALQHDARFQRIIGQQVRLRWLVRQEPTLCDQPGHIQWKAAAIAGAEFNRHDA